MKGVVREKVHLRQRGPHVLAIILGAVYCSSTYFSITACRADLICIISSVQERLSLFRGVHHIIGFATKTKHVDRVECYYCSRFRVPGPDAKETDMST